MNIDQIERKLVRLEKAHKDLTVQDTLALAAGRITDDEADKRHNERLCEIAELGQGTKAYHKAIDKSLRSEALRALRMRWKRYTDGYWHSKPDDRIDWTKAQKPVLVALMAASKGFKSFQVAIAWIAKKAGVSRSTVKRTIHLLEGEGLISKHERRISRDRSEWNEYKIICPKLLRWAQRHFLSKVGFKSEPHYRTLKGGCSTEDKTEVQSVTNDSSKCSQKARRSKCRAQPQLDTETFELVARAALEEIGEGLGKRANEGAILEAVQDMRERKQPDFNLYLWGQAEMKHGARKTALAFLQVQLLDRMRRRNDDDDRPWNERITIKDKNAYLYGILKKDRADCQPEITLGSILAPKDIYDLPKKLLKAVNDHQASREALKRNDDSGSALNSAAA